MFFLSAVFLIFHHVQSDYCFFLPATRVISAHGAVVSSAGSDSVRPIPSVFFIVLASRDSLLRS